MHRALILINPHSRSGDGDIEPILDRLREGGIELVMPESARAHHRDDDPARAIIDQGQSCDAIIVGGGDGTMNAMIDAVLEVGKPLGILPLGTANDLARTLGLPPRPEDNAGVILAGRKRRIDIGQVNGKHFFNVASLGISEQLARDLDADLKARWGVLSYPIRLWQAARQKRVFRAQIRLDDRVLAARAIQISVGNGRFYGGGMTIAADAEIDDAQLDLVLMAPQTIPQLLRRLPVFRWGRHDLNDGIRHWRGREITLETRKALPINTDGEITTETPAVSGFYLRRSRCSFPDLWPLSSTFAPLR